ncbi:FAD-dependent oxidoreductase, partial [Sutterella massiliensis]|nr:FAD-dependent oxidoreductase [Sutterella massiliensis]
MSSTMTRRSFFAKAAAASTAGFAATISLPASAIEVAAVPAKWDQTFDIVVIGSGGAGFTSAVAAAEAGAKVCILEKNSFVGGNTIVSGGAYNAVVPRRLQEGRHYGQRRAVLRKHDAGGGLSREQRACESSHAECRRSGCLAQAARRRVYGVRLPGLR